jgi:hypothetical protein
MAACATQGKAFENVCVGNGIPPVPDTDFRDFLDAVEEWARFAPEIIGASEKDLDGSAREPKRLRWADPQFLESQTDDLPAMNLSERNVLADEWKLAIGRPRMPGYAGSGFRMIRGFLGSLTPKPARRFRRESMSWYGFLPGRGLSLPGMTTILENVKRVSPATRSLILDRPIAFVLNEAWADCKTLTIDRTAGKANRAWPTDAKILTGWLRRANRLGQLRPLFGLKDFGQGRRPRWLDERDPLDFQICLAAGHPKSKGKLKKHYRPWLKRGRKAINSPAAAWNRVKQSLALETLPPSCRGCCRRSRRIFARRSGYLNTPRIESFTTKFLPPRRKF